MAPPLPTQDSGMSAPQGIRPPMETIVIGRPSRSASGSVLSVGEIAGGISLLSESGTTASSTPPQPFSPGNASCAASVEHREASSSSVRLHRGSEQKRNGTAATRRRSRTDCTTVAWQHFPDRPNHAAMVETATQPGSSSFPTTRTS